MAKSHQCREGHESKEDKRLWDDIHALDREIVRLITLRRKMSQEAKDGCNRNGDCLEGLPVEVTNYVMGIDLW